MYVCARLLISSLRWYTVHTTLRHLPHSPHLPYPPPSSHPILSHPVLLFAQIPAWAKGKALNEALTRQYASASQVDPDKIFPEVFTCDLEAIFPVSLCLYLHLTSCLGFGSGMCVGRM